MPSFPTELVERSILGALTTVVSSVFEAVVEVEGEASIAASKARPVVLLPPSPRAKLAEVPVLHWFQPAT